MFIVAVQSFYVLYQFFFYEHTFAFFYSFVLERHINLAIGMCLLAECSYFHSYQCNLIPLICILCANVYVFFYTYDMQGQHLLLAFDIAFNKCKRIFHFSFMSSYLANCVYLNVYLSVCAVDSIFVFLLLSLF